MQKAHRYERLHASGCLDCSGLIFTEYKIERRRYSCPFDNVENVQVESYDLSQDAYAIRFPDLRSFGLPRNGSQTGFIDEIVTRRFIRMGKVNVNAAMHPNCVNNLLILGNPMVIEMRKEEEKLLYAHVLVEPDAVSQFLRNIPKFIGNRRVLSHDLPLEIRHFSDIKRELEQAAQLP